MDGAEMLKTVVRYVAHGFRDFRRIHFVLDRASRPSDAFGVGLDVHGAAQRMTPAFDRREFALRVGGDEQHVGRRIVKITHPAGGLG
jgi:Ni,Fe-hydrogenase I small subunit